MTRWACIIGNPARQSLSPAMHNAAFAALAIDGRYEVREVDEAGLPAVIESLRDPSCFGANVTAPYKQTVLPYLRHLSPEAASLGAVNTLIQRDGALDADNTDARGLQTWLSTLGATLAGRPALLLGAGGASRAAIVALAGLGVSRIHLLNRTVARAEQVAADLRPRVPNVPIEVAPLDRAASEALEAMGVVINATSLGHHGSAPATHPSWYGTGGLGVELVYNPPETPFMREARAAGARTENGLGMLIHQAIVAFELWTGVRPDITIYEQAAARALEERKAHA